ncbi:MAG: WYL domain-containing protein [Planctomycetes bacterium]|nr:WYL domain-containing protein [Planctomycetota bacterium]
MARISKTERILNLTSFLLKSPVPVPWAEIQGKVIGYDDAADPDALERRFERDKKFLRALGIPIEYIPLDSFGHTGYFIEKADYYLPKIQIMPEDVAAIDLVSRISPADAGPLSEALQSALQKIQIDFPAPFEIRAEAEERGIRRGARTSAESGQSENLDLLLRAMLACKRVGFRYYTMGRDSTSDREVDPYGLGHTHGAWYLVGRCLVRKDIRVFKIARILGDVRILNEDREAPDFEVPPDFRLGDHIGKPAWLLEDGRPIEVKVRFDSTTAWMAAGAIGSGDAFSEADDGSGDVTMQVTAVEPFIRWVLSFAQHAVVVSPPWLREQVSRRIEAVAKKYGR